LRLKGRCHVVVGDLEIERVRKSARHCRVLALSRYVEKLKKTNADSPAHADVIAAVLRERRIKKVAVPANFPHGLARELRDRKIKVKVPKGPLFPDRERKSAEEVKKISAALTMAEVGLSEGIQALKSAKVSKDGRLIYHNVPLTSEKLRAVIDTAIIQAGGLATHTIVAGGRQGCDLHERGHGPLRANQTIIINASPRSQRTGYFGDITRTVVKGRASETVRKLYHTVTQAQELAFKELRQGKTATEIHEAVQSYFEENGYKTGRQNGRMEGFFHGTGHGVGLEIREAPQIGPTSRDTLRAGHVVTVEPGLYYSTLGGVRLEDIALVTSKVPRNLTKFEKVLEL